MDTQKFQEIINKIYSSDTSSNPQNWTAENPAMGHCAVVSLLAQDYFGGVLLRKSLQDAVGFENMRSHYLNKLPDGKEIDFTIDQFQGKLPENVPTQERDREEVISYPDTKRRYDILKSRFIENLV